MREFFLRRAVIGPRLQCSNLIGSDIRIRIVCLLYLYLYTYTFIVCLVNLLITVNVFLLFLEFLCMRCVRVRLFALIIPAITYIWPMHAHFHTHIHTHTQTYTHTLLHTRTHAHTHTYVVLEVRWLGNQHTLGLLEVVSKTRTQLDCPLPIRGARADECYRRQNMASYSVSVLDWNGIDIVKARTSIVGEAVARISDGLGWLHFVAQNVGVRTSGGADLFLPFGNIIKSWSLL